jgi:hypothetical protein
LFVLDIIGFALVVIVLVPRLKPIFAKATWITRPICWMFQIPLGSKLNKFKDSLINRSGKSDPPSALAYMERVIDRQINKARGILPFNSIIMTINSFGVANSRDIKAPYVAHLVNQTERWNFVTAAISSLLLLELFWSHWGKAHIYSTIENDVVEGVIIARNRAIILDTAIVLSLACVFGVIITIFAVDYHSGTSVTTPPFLAPHSSSPPAQGESEVKEVQNISNNLKDVTDTLKSTADNLVNATPWLKKTDDVINGLQLSTDMLKESVNNLIPTANALLIELKRPPQAPVSPRPKPALKHTNRAGP